jgi:bifunctional DNase/RNase
VIVARIIRRLARGIVREMARRWLTTLLALVMLAGGVWSLWSRGMIPGAPAVGGLPGMERSASAATSDVREMTIDEIRPARGGRQLELVLKEKGGNRHLVMGVGEGEAMAIASDMGNRKANPPVTYDLMRTLIQELGGSVNRVVVSNVTETTFYAKVVMNAADRQIEVESRPSDAIALALRSKAPIFAETSVLDKAGRVNPG